MEGILTGCDINQEWLLPWWYDHLRRCNPDIPVAFGDLGMSEEGKRWCSERGLVIPVTEIPSVSVSDLSNGWAYCGEKWRSVTISGTSHRSTLFRKPFLMKLSPFDRTLWLDLDCQVLKSISPLFLIRLPPTNFAIRRDPVNVIMKSTENQLHFVFKCYNSGVVLFEKGSSLLDFWTFFIQQACHNFSTDDQMIAFAICNYNFSVGKIPYKYNWLQKWGSNSEAAILHWNSYFKTALWLELLARGSNL